MAVQTRFTKAFGTKWPIASAAMTGVAGPALAIAAHRGGAFPFLASHKGTIDVKSFQSDIAIIRKELNIPSGRLPIGAGCLCWMLEATEEANAHALLDEIMRETSAVWLSFANDLQKWAKYVKSNGSIEVTLCIVASTVAEARTAVELKADIVIVQGVEAGGHGNSRSLPLTSLLPAVIDALGSPRPIILAAGGIVTGSQAAGMLAMGADGVVLGTALLATDEAVYSDAQKQAIVDAKDNATQRTMVFDVMRNTMGWPKGIDGRGLRNKTVEDSIEGRSQEELQRDYDAAARTNDTSRICVWAGTSVHLVKQKRPAAEVIEAVGNHIVVSLQRAAQLVV